METWIPGSAHPESRAPPKLPFFIHPGAGLNHHRHHPPPHTHTQTLEEGWRAANGLHQPPLPELSRYIAPSSGHFPAAPPPPAPRH